MRSPLVKTLLNINAGYSFLVSSVYMGVMWALHFFWYPSWNTMRLENAQNQFVSPTTAATNFFTILVPIMMLSSIIMMITEWKTNVRWTTIIIFLGIVASTIVGKLIIIPINITIAHGVASQEIFDGLLQRWMVLNNWRMFITTIMWSGCLFYFMFRKHD